MKRLFLAAMVILVVAGCENPSFRSPCMDTLDYCKETLLNCRDTLVDCGDTLKISANTTEKCINSLEEVGDLWREKYAALQKHMWEMDGSTVDMNLMEPPQCEKVETGHWRCVGNLKITQFTGEVME